jgi:phosphate starvation-inducible PhoH-like protein
LSETRILLEHIHPVELLGPNNNHLKLLQQHFPEIRITARGKEIILQGSDQKVAHAEEQVHALIDLASRTTLTERKLQSFLREGQIGVAPQQNARSYDAQDPYFLVMGNQGAIVARTENQKRLVKEVVENDVVFAVGPAGTGKTYTSVALAVRALKAGEINRIILTRPAVEAGESLGFLPGDLKEKIDPYLQPLYDALFDMLPGDRLREYMENRTIEVAPLAFMRGRTLNNAYVILDEAQNATSIQLKMFLTRMGPNAKFIITGDITQVDLPRQGQSGLGYSVQLLKDIEGVSVVHLDVADVVRHRIVKDIINAYEGSRENE